MERQVTEHDEHRVGAILPVLGSARPVCSAERLQSSNESSPVRDEAVERPIEVHVEKEIVRILFARQVWANHRCRITQHVLEAVEKERVHVREVAGVFVSRPPARSRSALQDSVRDFTDERHHYVRRTAQRVNDGDNAVQWLRTRGCDGLTPQLSCKGNI